MSNIYLLGAFGFIYLVMRWDRRMHPDAPAVLWLPTLWMMRCGSRAIDAWIGGGDFGRLDPLFIAALLAGGIIVLASRPCNWGAIVAHNSAIFLFYGYLILSVTWVENGDNPFIKVLRPLGDFVMALVIATSPSPREALMAIARRTVIFLIPLSIVLIRYFHDLGTLQSKHWGDDIWVGVTTHKNPLGQLALVSALVFLWMLSQARQNGEKLLQQRICWIYLAFTAYLFNGGGAEESRSSTALLCLATAIALYVGFGRLRNRISMIVRTIALGLVALVMVVVVLQFAGSSLQAVVAGMMGKDPTLTDRAYLWEDIIRLGLEESPLLGSGYGGFWNEALYPRLNPIIDNGPKQAHNGYLETFANLGLIGVGLLALTIVQALRSASTTANQDFEYGRLRLVLLFTTLLLNYSEATFTVGCHLWWFLFLTISVYAQPWVRWPQPPVPQPVSDEAA